MTHPRHFPPQNQNTKYVPTCVVAVQFTWTKQAFRESGSPGSEAMVDSLLAAALKLSPFATAPRSYLHP